MGVASPSAHGQAMMSTATAAVNAAVQPAPAINQPTAVSTERTNTTGTNTEDTRSARRWTGAFPVWARSTAAAICASSVSAPTRSARAMSRPVWLTAAPISGSPGPTSIGTDSPVIRALSTDDAPDSTTASVAIRSPGRTTNSSPTCNCPIGMSTSRPSRKTVASLAPSLSRAVTASPARSFARDSA